SDTKQIHAVPAINKTAAKPLSECRLPLTTMSAPTVTTPAETTVSRDQRARKLGISNAPAIAPPPKTPRSSPYPIALLLTSWAIEGSSASSPLAKNIEAACRSITVLISGEKRTYRNPAVIAPASCSGGAERFLAGLFHRATTPSTPTNKTSSETNATATPAAAITTPANAGPSERAKLNS